MGRRDSASAWSAAALRCVASLLACCAGKRFAFPQLRTLAGSNPSACPQESALGRYGLRALNFNGWAAETYGEHLHVRPALRLRRRGGVAAPRALGPVQPAPDRLGDCPVRVGAVVAVGPVRAARDTVGDQPALVLLDGAAVHLAALNAAELRVNLAAHLLLQRQHHVRADALARFRPFDTAIRGPEVGLVGEPLAGDHAVRGRA